MALSLTELALSGVILYAMQNTLAPSTSDKIDIYRQRDIRGLSTDTQDIIKLITFSDTTEPVGSFKYKVHKYPGDIDIFEPVKICCTKQKAVDTITRELQSIAKRVKNSKRTYWADFKAGIDPVLHPQDRSLASYISSAGRYLSPEDLAYVTENYPENARKFYIVRWTADEIIRGEKTLLSRNVLTLKEAITHDSLIKLDLWSMVEGNYTEVTNFFFFLWQDEDGNTTVLNAELEDRLVSLERDIEKYGSEEHWNPLKLAKRLWNKALFTKDHSMTERLYPLFSSGASQLNQIVGESETIRAMLTRLPNPPVERLMKQIEGFKRRINDVTDINITSEPELYSLIDGATRDSGATISNLLRLEAILSKITRDFSEEFLKGVQTLPSPRNRRNIYPITPTHNP